MTKLSYDASGNILIRKLGTVPPQIVGQPVTQVAVLGTIATFSVVVSDASGVTFQWKFNGIDIPGATGDSLLLTNVSAVNEGQYSVVVTNSAGSVMSAPADLLMDSDTDPNDKASLRPRLAAYSGAGGSVMVAPMRLSYAPGEIVTLTALAFPPNIFMGWAKDLIGNANPDTLIMNGNKTVRARFATAVPLPASLIALWRGEADASDLIGGHHGTFFAGASVTPPSVTLMGKVGGAFNFDGTVHVRIPDSAALKPAQLTAEAWVFPTVLGGTQTIIARGNFGNAWDLRLANSMPQFWSHGGQGLEGPSVISLNAWTHLAISFDGTTKRLYVNGAEVASHSGMGALVYGAASVPMTIGSDWAGNTSGNGFNGRIDEVALYSRALSTDEVLSIYNADFLGKNFSLPYFTSPSQLPAGVLGANYTQQLTTILGTPSISFSLVEGLLPLGITFSSAGLLSGIPSALGTFVFTARATDATGAFTEKLCELRVG